MTMPGSLDPMRRLVTKRSYTDRFGLKLIFWSMVAAGCTVCVLVVVTLITDVLITQAQLANDSASLRASSTETDLGLQAQADRFGSTPGWGWLPGLVDAVPMTHSSYGAICLLVIAGLIFSSGVSFALSWSLSAAAGSARQTGTWLRNSIHRQTLRLGPSDLTEQRHQFALRLFTKETDDLRAGMTQWRWRLLRALTIVPVLVVSVLAIDWRLALECLIPAAACWWVYRFERARGAAMRQLSEAHGEAEVRFLSEALKQTRLVRGYHMEEFEQTLFDKHLSRLTEETSMGRRTERIALSTAWWVVRLGMALILLLIALRTLSTVSPLPLASGVTLAAAMIWLAREVSSLERMFTEQKSISLIGDRIYRYLDEIPEVGQAVGAKFIEPASKAIVFENVFYQQQGHEILRGIDLRIEAGTQISLVSLDPLLARAMAYLLTRFIEPSKGRVLFDGEDIAWGTLESIRTEVAYVGHDDPFLTGTVADNLICGDSRYSVQDAMEAAKSVHAHKSITALPQGYETVLGEHGEQLTPSVAFRLGLARAALRDPAVVIIDEPNVVMDDDSRALIDDAYQRLSQKRTMIFLPGRLSTIRRCDQVVMLHEGKVDSIGPHSTLAKSSELYRHFDYITFNTFSRRMRRLNPS